MMQQSVDIDPLVGQHAVDLLDRMLGHKAAGQRQTLPDQRNREGGRLDYPQRGPRQRDNASGMQVAGEHGSQEAVDVLERDLLVGWQRTALCVGSDGLESHIRGVYNAFPQLIIIRTSTEPSRVFS